ncbi:IclR family transcriptional regulator domain-containing protein [Actinoallomurus iriomotensis]|uniref:IclR-ED domain-containing protein n=1 Tax=Actinoallomurus iriomotensis TaxID=478107 RepID=A0A9W6VXQ4_9ACTN|nr:IclR family transcriptional regulator C-terminal domain-containing protein [Actinoallomurus iriomotensis]GLY83499.1 hypothetical protein Airi02_014290 [Actinoallomurus iriomotensis]
MVHGEIDEVAPLRPGLACSASTAAGKVLLAAVRPQHLLDPRPAGRRREAAEIRDRGVAFDHQGLVSGVCCAAVPLHGADGRPIAALCVMAEPGRPLRHLTRTTGRVAQSISLQLRH